MNEFITLTEYNWAFWVAGLFALLEFAKWLFSMKEFVFVKLGIKTKEMLKREEYNNRLKKVEEAIDEIKDTSRSNLNMFTDHKKQVFDRITDIRDEVILELSKLHNKIDQQKTEMDKTNELNVKTDCAMLRDRIASGMRYFGQNKDENGNVHIGLSDYENMESLFQEYFSKNGNGTYKKMHEEFEKFIIDR